MSHFSFMAPRSGQAQGSDSAVSSTGWEETSSVKTTGEDKIYGQHKDANWSRPTSRVVMPFGKRNSQIIPAFNINSFDKLFDKSPQPNSSNAVKKNLNEKSESLSPLSEHFMSTNVKSTHLTKAASDEYSPEKSAKSFSKNMSEYHLHEDLNYKSKRSVSSKSSDRTAEYAASSGSSSVMDKKPLCRGHVEEYSMRIADRGETGGGSGSRRYQEDYKYNDRHCRSSYKSTSSRSAEKSSHSRRLSYQEDYFDLEADFQKSSKNHQYESKRFRDSNDIEDERRNSRSPDISYSSRKSSHYRRDDCFDTPTRSYYRARRRDSSPCLKGASKSDYPTNNSSWTDDGHESGSKRHSTVGDYRSSDRRFFKSSRFKAEERSAVFVEDPLQDSYFSPASKSSSSHLHKRRYSVEDRSDDRCHGGADSDNDYYKSKKNDNDYYKKDDNYYHKVKKDDDDYYYHKKDNYYYYKNDDYYHKSKKNNDDYYKNKFYKYLDKASSSDDSELKDRVVLPSIDVPTRRGTQEHYLKNDFGFCDIRNFKIKSQISEGTYGIVYKGYDMVTNEKVALKFIKFTINSKTLNGFPLSSLREIRALKSLSHPRIVHLRQIAADKVGEHFYLVLSYVDYDLYQLLYRFKKRFSIAEIKHLIYQLLEAVEFMHYMSFFHRDLKASNVLIDRDEQLFLTDFGWAKNYSPIEQKLTPHAVTIGYRAPELIFRAERYNLAVDIWSVGCIAAEMILGHTLIDSKRSKEQAELFVALFGAPNEHNFGPNHTSLQEAPKGDNLNYYNNLRSQFVGKLTPLGLDFLTSLLQYNPEKRITASQALKHKWFFEEPLPKAQRIVLEHSNFDDT